VGHEFWLHETRHVAIFFHCLVLIRLLDDTIPEFFLLYPKTFPNSWYGDCKNDFLLLDGPGSSFEVVGPAWLCDVDGVATW
jgi:hypothetical protein